MRKGAHAPGMDVAPILGLQINELRGIARIATVRFISGLVVSLSELESPLFYALKISANSSLTCCSWLARHPKMQNLGGSHEAQACKNSTRTGNRTLDATRPDARSQDAVRYFSPTQNAFSSLPGLP